MTNFTYTSEKGFFKFGQLDFVGQYKEVTALKYDSYRLSYEEVWHLISSLPSLKEIKFIASENFTDSTDFMRILDQFSLELIHVEIRGKLAEKFRTLTWTEPWEFKIGGYGANNELKWVTFSRKRSAAE